MFENWLLKVTEVVVFDLPFVSQSELFDNIAPSQLTVCCGVFKECRFPNVLDQSKDSLGKMA